MIEQSKDVYSWHALCTDGRIFNEFDIPEGRGFTDVENLSIKEIWLTHDDQKKHTISLPEFASPIFFRRRRRAMNIIDNIITIGTTTHCIGWIHNDTAIYLFVYEDGNTLLSSYLQAA